MSNGRVNPAKRLEDQGITGLGHVYYNLIEPALVQAAVTRGEGVLGNGGAFLCDGVGLGRVSAVGSAARGGGAPDRQWRGDRGRNASPPGREGRGGKRASVQLSLSAIIPPSSSA